jgi:hypothetical protein
MRIERQTIYAIEGVGSLSTDPVSIASGMRLRISDASGADRIPVRVNAHLTTDVDGSSLQSDRRDAVATMLMTGRGPRLGNQRMVGKEITTIRRHRGQKWPGQLWLVTEVSRATRPLPRGRTIDRRTPTFDMIMPLGGPPSTLFEFREQAREVEMSVLGALRLSRIRDLRYTVVQSATYVVDRNGCPEYWMMPEAYPAEIRTSVNVTPRSAQQLRDSVRAALSTDHSLTGPWLDSEVL